VRPVQPVQPLPGLLEQLPKLFQQPPPPPK
jgi:hypothetical protein